jgi:6-phosphogluconolactonase
MAGCSSLSGTGRWIGRRPADTIPREFAIDAERRVLLAAGLDSNHLALHAMDPEDGTLSQRDRMGSGAC